MTGGEDGTGTRQGLRRGLQVLVLGRLGVATLLLGGSLLLLDHQRYGGFTEDALRLLILSTYVVSLVFALALAEARSLTFWAGLQLAWDLLMVTGLIYLFGGATSGFAFLYGVTIVAAALIVGPRQTQVVTASALLLFIVVGLSLSNGWLPHPRDPFEARVGQEDLGLALLRTLVGLVLIGILAVALAERVQRVGGRAQRAEASAAGFAKLTEDILRSMASGLLTTDLEGRVRSVNAVAASVLRAEPSDLVGRRIDDHFPVVVGEPTFEVRREGLCTRADGTTFPVGFTQTPLRNAADRVHGSLLLFTDLTELEELRRTAQQAERLAALGRLATGLAHEIRNPLGSIRGSVELVLDARDLSDEDRRLLRLVLGEVDRLNDLVGTMLDVGRPRDPEPTTVDLAAICAELVEVRGDRSPRVELEVLADRPVHASADPGQLRQVLWNLVRNALHFSPSSGTVRIQVGAAEAARARLSVSDEGPGIAPEDRDRVFDMFYSTRRHGVGLGLALVKQIVEAHRGEVTVESQEGRGTTVSVHLPVPAPESGAVAEPPASRPGAEATPREPAGGPDTVHPPATPA
ncbi:MAG: nitrogen regulation protein NR(II) [Sandaracinaceae bacterium]